MSRKKMNKREVVLVVMILLIACVAMLCGCETVGKTMDTTFMLCDVVDLWESPTLEVPLDLPLMTCPGCGKEVPTLVGWGNYTSDEMVCDECFYGKDTVERWKKEGCY